ncbi:MAG TPA: hypothetical protein VN181_15000 [Thermoanaerobaculia bacterium]|nr:hypothetical protein [Thermoanaerobaculia bacterium]
MPFKREDDRVIRKAIAEKRMIRFSLDGRERIGEPHDYGMRKGKPSLLVWQVGGYSRSGMLPEWRWILIEKASDFELLAEKFAGGRGDDKRQTHSDWEEVWARVKPA